jgi:tetratricopeptide (TPR) repeat protein
MGAALGLLTAWVERVHIGAQGEAWSFSFVERCLIAGRALWFYAGKLLLPVNLTFSYPRWEIDASEWWQYLFLLAAVSAAVAMWAARSRIGRGPLVAVLIFAGNLFPALGFINVYPMRYSFVADHFQYLASLGLIVLFVELVRRVCELGFGEGQRRVTISVAACVLAALLGPLTWSQARLYRDNVTLYGDVVAKNPSSWMAHHNLAREFVAQQRLDAAIDHFEQALALKSNLPEVHVGLGIALGRLGRHDQALRHLEEAIRLAPDDFVAHTNLGIALASTGDLARAINHYSRALAVNPGFSPAHYNLANALYEQGNPDQATHHYLQALESDPGHVLAHYYLARALSQQGKLDQALHHYNEALQLEPRFVDARYELAIALAKQNQVEPAVEALRRVLRDAPGHPDARRALQRLIGSDK